MGSQEYRWQWVGIMTHYHVNIPEVQRHKPKRISFTQEEIIIMESNQWYDSYHQCTEAAKQSDVDIPDSWGLELRIISRDKIHIPLTE